MSKLLTILFALFVFASCKTIQPVVETKIVIKDSIVNTTEIIYRDSTIYLPGDTTEIGFAIPCPEFSQEKKKGNTTIGVKSDGKGNVKITCREDSLKLVIDSLQTIISKKEVYHSEEKTTVVEKPVTVLKYKIPKWCWWLLIINIALLAWRFRNPIGAFIKKAVGK